MKNPSLILCAVQLVLVVGTIGVKSQSSGGDRLTTIRQISGPGTPGYNILADALEYTGAVDTYLDMSVMTLLGPGDPAWTWFLGQLRQRGFNFTQVEDIPLDIMQDIMAYHFFPTCLSDMEGGELMKPMGPEGSEITVEVEKGFMYEYVYYETDSKWPRSKEAPDGDTTFSGGMGEDCAMMIPVEGVLVPHVAAAKLDQLQPSK